MTDTDERREAVARILHRRLSPAGVRPDDHSDGYCYDLADDLAPLIARMVADAKAEALRDAADAWTQGQWSDVMLPKPTPPAVPVIAYANRVGDWLRARADEVTR